MYRCKIFSMWYEETINKFSEKISGYSGEDSKHGSVVTVLLYKFTVNKILQTKYFLTNRNLKFSSVMFKLLGHIK